MRYDAVNAMLPNEFLKEHRKVEEQEKRIDALTAQLKEQAAQIQGVHSSPQRVRPVADLRQISERRKWFSIIGKAKRRPCSHGPVGRSELASSGDAPQARGYSFWQ